MHSFGPNALIFHANHFLSCIAEYALLLPMLLKVLLVRETFFSDGPEHVVTLTDLVVPLHFLLLVLQSHRLV